MENRFKSIGAYLELIKKNTSHDRSHFWFRGQGGDFRLLPSILRSPATQLRENEIIDEFYFHAQTLLAKNPEEGWDWLALMQHHRLPTRLLDWSESPLTAVYFAISTWKPDSTDTPTIFIFNPYQLNRNSICDEYVYFAEGEKLKKWLPRTLKEYISIKCILTDHEKKKFNGKYPIAIYAKPRVERVRAQQGCFTLHGSQAIPIDQYCAESIVRLQLELSQNATLDEKKEIRAHFLVDLDMLGINEFTIYRDLDSLSSHIKSSESDFK